MANEFIDPADALLREIRNLKARFDSHSKTMVLNEKRVKDVKRAYETIERILSQESAPNATLSIKITGLTQQDVYIEVIARELVVQNVKDFLVALANNCSADNFEIYPRIDDKIQINFLFNDVFDVMFEDRKEVH
jgi:hypothetical protein